MTRQLVVMVTIYEAQGDFQDRLYLSVPLAAIPAQAGIHLPAEHWIPACAGMTGRGAFAEFIASRLLPQCTRDILSRNRLSKSWT